MALQFVLNNLTTKVILRYKVTQVIVSLASSYRVIWVKLQRNLSQVATRFNRDCHMIGYILFYKLPVIIWWQWILCRAMSAMLGHPDFRSYEWQRILCYAMRHFSCSNCVAVMLLKARGWRGTSLPRGNDNAWFSNPVRVLLLPITWRIRKSWTRSGFISYVHFIPT